MHVTVNKQTFDCETSTSNLRTYADIRHKIGFSASKVKPSWRQIEAEWMERAVWTESEPTKNTHHHSKKKYEERFLEKWHKIALASDVHICQLMHCHTKAWLRDCRRTDLVSCEATATSATSRQEKTSKNLQM